MRIGTSARLALAVSLALLASGCALTSKSDSVVLRYFTPERQTARPASAAIVEHNEAPNLQVRLGRVNSASYLKDRIAFRDSEYEVGFYEELRWTEKPESYVRRATIRSLFEERQVRQIISGVGPTLEVELNAFDELRTPKHAARVEMTWILRDAQAVVLQKTIVVERPIEASKPEALASAVANAMSDALAEAVKTMVSGVTLELTRSQSSSSAPSDRSAINAPAP